MVSGACRGRERGRGRREAALLALTAPMPRRRCRRPLKPRVRNGAPKTCPQCSHTHPSEDYPHFLLLCPRPPRTSRPPAGMKEFSQWPTFPQVYIDGEFFGGADILIAAYTSGELAEEVERAINN